ncbi:uncharacterized protein LOC129273708 [Lytechinus pictus]|uniref:uncharacterized protein LOC129273708 n=1 Tax=Lytechinus pictus TaxID=7653 RepID=UPI0030B9EC25
MESKEKQDQNAEGKRKKPFLGQDVIAWFLGIIFITALLTAVKFLGEARGWDADSGFTHNTSETSSERFLSEPFVEEPGVIGRCGTGATSRWYYWKLKPEEVTTLTRVIPWLCYTLHQLFVWSCIYYAQKKKTVYADPDVPRYSSNMKIFNWVALIGNMVFHLIHLGQTHWTYDSLAQDVSSPSNIGSAIIILIFVLMLEYRNRGMAFGWPSQDDKGKISNRMRLPWGPQAMIRKYHGYIFAWGAVFTFWHHPMENTIGHVMGFVHTWMFLLQGSLMFTKVHLNRYWRFLLEAWVIIHGTVVAWQTGNYLPSLYPMFMFGFLWLLVMTQLFGLPFWQSLPKWSRFIPFAIYLITGICIYGFVLPDGDGNYWSRLNEMVRIPAIEYFGILFGWVVMWFFMWIEEKMKGDKYNEPFQPPSTIVEILYICGVVFTYAIMMAVSILVQSLDWQTGIITLLMFFMLFFTLGVAVTCMLLRQIIRPVNDRHTVKEVSPTKVEPAFVNEAFNPDDTEDTLPKKSTPNDMKV